MSASALRDLSVDPDEELIGSRWIRVEELQVGRAFGHRTAVAHEVRHAVCEQEEVRGAQERHRVLEGDDAPRARHKAAAAKSDAQGDSRDKSAKGRVRTATRQGQLHGSLDGAVRVFPEFDLCAEQTEAPEVAQGGLERFRRLRWCLRCFRAF